MDFVFNLEEVKAAQESVAGGFGILETGMYKNCTIVRGVASKTKAGNNALDLSIKTETGHECTIYQAFIMDAKWASGKDNTYGYAAFLRFAKAAGMNSAETFQDALLDRDGKPVIGKKTQAPVVFTSFKALAGKKVDLGIQKAFDVFDGKEQITNCVYDTFACGSESSDKLGDRLKDKHSVAYKAFLADGGASSETEDSDATEDASEMEDF